ncbi:MAG: glycosyltransferase family 39 protein [Acidobacteriia bacterium]|nr:glycosyltransferase family 39 protein [Terriglobia bacterium]
MPASRRKPNELVGQAMPLLLLGMALVSSNHYVTFVDDEVRSLDAAAQPVRSLFASFLAGPGRADIPPLYGIVLHFWLRSTNWNFEYLRIPAIAFFLVGLFFLARAAHRFGGPTAASAAVWVGILWPFGFHYGRLAAPYSFVFFLIAGLTFTYLRFLEQGSFERWAALFLFGAALLWTSAVGWAVLACLAIDQVIRRRAGENKLPIAVLARTAILWIAAFVPLLRASYGEWVASIHVHHSFSSSVTNCALQIYNLFVSESVAPWRWQLSVPAAIGVLACAVLVFMKGTWASRRYLIFGLGLIIMMAAIGNLAPRRLCFAAPWVVLAIAVAIGSIESRWARPSFAVALLLVGGLGWYGIYSRRFYSAPQFLEPWAQLAGDDAGKIQTGATVVSNSRPFFLYLTYALQPPTSSTEPILVGLLPDFAVQPAVKTAQQWLSAGHPMTPAMIWIHGADDPDSEPAMENAAQELDRACGSRVSRLMMRDTGFEWKQRFLPEEAIAPWRIESREYDCASSNSQEIYPIPAR